MHQWKYLKWFVEQIESLFNYRKRTQAMPKNRYVDFISDKDFLECVNGVCKSYASSVGGKVDLERLMRNTVDPFKVLFDTHNLKISLEKWIINERMRQEDKTINNEIGYFHQKLLGKVDGWKNLGTGDESNVDLKKEDNSVFIELKNKYNTMNSDATKECRQKLERIISKYPEATAYWAFIISKTGTSGETVWAKGGFQTKDNLRKIWGKKVYELVTGDPDAMEKTWRALPKALDDILKSKTGNDKREQKEILKFFKSAFER